MKTYDIKFSSNQKDDEIEVKSKLRRKVSFKNVSFIDSEINQLNTGNSY